MIYFSCKRKWGLNKVLGLPVSATRDFFFFPEEWTKHRVCGGRWVGRGQHGGASFNI